MNLANGADLLAVLAEVMKWGSALSAIYFTVALVLTLAQEHLGAVAGRPGVMAELYERSIPLVICIAVAASAATIGAAVGQSVGASAQDISSAVNLWRTLGQFVGEAVILSAGASLAVGFATGVLSGQLSLLVGTPGALSSIWMRLMLVIVTGVLTLLSVRLASLVIGLLWP